jgi:uncharacterized protein with PIN domain
MVILSRYGEHGEREVDLLVQRAAIDVIPVSPEHAELNLGDCFSYALAASLDEPLLGGVITVE